MWRSVNIKNSKINNNSNNSYEIKPKTYKRFGCPLLKVRTNIDLWTKRLIKASKRTSTCNGLAGRHTSIVSPLKIQKIFLNVVEIIFGMHKDPRIKK